MLIIKDLEKFCADKNNMTPETSKLIDEIPFDVKLEAVSKVFAEYQRLTGRSLLEDLSNDSLDKNALYNAAEFGLPEDLLATLPKGGSRIERILDEDYAKNKDDPPEVYRDLGFYNLALSPEKGFVLQPACTYRSVNNPNKYGIYTNGELTEFTYTAEGKGQHHFSMTQFVTFDKFFKGGPKYASKFEEIWSERKCEYVDGEFVFSVVKLRDEVGDPLSKRDFLEEIENGCKTIGFDFLMIGGERLLYDSVTEGAEKYYDDFVREMDQMKEICI